MEKRVRMVVAWMSWPGLLALCTLSTWAGFVWGMPMLGFYLTYAVLTVALLLLQRWMPHEAAWRRADGQLLPDLSHTVLSTAAVQGMLAFSGMVGLAAGATLFEGEGIWPHGWPLWLQVVIGLTVLEFALYWAHRIAHEWRPLWHFHAVHHSVSKLWVVNNGRFHFVDAIKSVLPGIVLLTALGAPLEVLTWLSALGAYIGMMTHSNAAMRCGKLSWVFNTPELHRWHHSRDLREGNRNYGESLMLWDWVFGTYFNAVRRPPVDIGIAEAMPDGFLAQVVWPFRQFGKRYSSSSESSSASTEGTA